MPSAWPEAQKLIIADSLLSRCLGGWGGGLGGSEVVICEVPESSLTCVRVWVFLALREQWLSAYLVAKDRAL